MLSRILGPWRGEVMGDFQGTLAKPVKFSGRGLHGNKCVDLTVLPALVGTGIEFVRVDLDGCPVIPACPEYIVSTDLCTTLGLDNICKVSTVEHLISALIGTGIHNATICVNAGEVPVLDGSALEFVKSFKEVGICKQPEEQRLIRVKKRIASNQNDQFMVIEPWEDPEDTRLIIDCSIDFCESPVIGKQSFSWEFSLENYQQLYKARTFCQLKTVRYMHSKGLALGGSLENAIVADGDKVLNPEGLRYKDEFVRHKILDCFGDIGLLGGRLVGRLRVHKGGHTLHSKFIKEIWQNKHLITPVVRDKIFHVYPTVSSTN